MDAELAGAGGSVGLNPALWVWAGEGPGRGWAQPLGRDGECSPALSSQGSFSGISPEAFTWGIFFAD